MNLNKNALLQWRRPYGGRYQNQGKQPQTAIKATYSPAIAAYASAAAAYASAADSAAAAASASDTAAAAASATAVVGRKW